MDTRHRVAHHAARGHSAVLGSGGAGFARIGAGHRCLDCVNDIEYRQEGMALAFVDPEVVSPILNHQEGVAVLVTQWGGFAVSGVPCQRRVLSTEQDIAAFATGLRGDAARQLRLSDSHRQRHHLRRQRDREQRLRRA
ncbi:MAG: DUF1194 domain-containing protein [Rhodospirillaceae bacterium]|nr:DUF1194 domain-containing protein [Rhodospirillaceae bacterium]